DGAGLHVAELHAAAGLAAGFDGESQPMPLLVEREIADVAEGQFIARRQIAQDEVAAAGAVAARRRRWTERRRQLRRRRSLKRCRARRTLQRQAGGRLAVKGETTNALELDLRAVRQVDEHSLARRRRRRRNAGFLWPSRTARLLGGRDREGKPLA